MKYFFIIILFFSLNAMSQNIKYKYIRPELRPKVTNGNQIFKGKVKDVKCKIEYFNNEKSEKASYIHWKFDQIGNMTYYSYLINGNNGDRYVNLFDDKNNLISTKWYNEKTNELYKTTNYTYDNFNRLESVELLNKMGEVRGNRKYFYKDSDKPYEIHFYEDNVIDLSKPNGYYKKELSEINKLEYDPKGNLIKIDKINGNNELESTLRFIYDVKDRCIEECIYLPEPGFAFIYDFNDEDNSVLFFNSRNGIKDLLHLDRYVGDKLISFSTFRDSKIFQEKIYKYDEKGNLISMDTFENGKKISKMENIYLYDNFSNHLTIEVYLDDKKIELKTYEFKYYL